MSKAKFAAAKELIDEKKYDEARGILKTIDHPTAREWEAKLDKISPPFKPPEPIWTQTPPPLPPLQLKPAVKSKPVGCGTVLLLTAAIFIIIALIRTPSTPSIAEPTRDLTAVAADKIAFNATATIIALTPSATITETPIPSITPTPAPTNIPPTEVQGSKGNPYPAQTEGAIRDGRFRVNRLLVGQADNVNNENMFNEKPPAGGEYVIVYVTFFCDLPSDKTCNVSAMNFDLIGKMGTVYNVKMFTTLHNPFRGEVFGGGETSGDIAFIVNASDGQYIVAVNDLGNRTFFAANQIN
jgi:hypothetical protein